MTDPVKFARPLAWRRPTEEDDDNGHGEAFRVADGLCGAYAITLTDARDNGRCALWWAHNGFLFEEFGSVMEAMAAAEADWQRRFARKVADAVRVKMEGFEDA